MGQLTIQELNSATGRLQQFKDKAAVYFDAVDNQVFAGLSYTANQAAIKSRADQARGDYQQAVGLMEQIILGHMYQGRVPSLADIEEVTQLTNNALDRYHSAATEWNASHPVATFASTIATLFLTAKDSLLALQEGFTGATRTISRWIPWIPWIVVGAFVLPTVLKVWAKKRREGTEAALEYTAESIESGRAATGRGIKRAGMLATQAGMVAAGVPPTAALQFRNE